MILVKLGGSVITNKMILKEFREDRTSELAWEISRSPEDVFLVHGAGSFGHMLARKYSLHKGHENENQLSGLATVLMDMRELNLMVMREFGKVGVPCASIPPSSTAELDNGKLIRLPTREFGSYSRLGVMPITFGDVCLDRSRGFGICSGDQLMEWLAREFSPERVIFCTDVDGVYTADPHVHHDAEIIPEIDDQILRTLSKAGRSPDVTNSIYGKVESMLEIASHVKECLVINGLVPGRLDKALKGKEVLGSRVIGGA